MGPGDRARPAGAVCVCAPVSVHPRRRQARNELVALPADHGRVYVPAGISGRRRDIPHWPRAGGVVSHWMQIVVVAVAVVASAAYAAYVLMPSAWRQRIDAFLDSMLPASLRRRRASQLSGCAGCG